MLEKGTFLTGIEKYSHLTGNVKQITDEKDIRQTQQSILSMWYMFPLTSQQCNKTLADFHSLPFQDQTAVIVKQFQHILAKDRGQEDASLEPFDFEPVKEASPILALVVRSTMSGLVFQRLNQQKYLYKKGYAEAEWVAWVILGGYRFSEKVIDNKWYELVNTMIFDKEK